MKIYSFFYQPLRYARLEKADILEMVVKHLKDIKKRRQAVVSAMEPILFRSFKMGFIDCTRATIDFINEIESHGSKKQQIIEHITQECMKTFQSRNPPLSFHQHHEVAFANFIPSDQLLPFSFSKASFDGDHSFEWTSIDEKLGFSSIENSSFLSTKSKLQPAATLTSIYKISEPRASAFNDVNKLSESNLESPSTFAASISVVENMEGSVALDQEENNNDDDDPNNNQMTWRPWL